LLLNPPARFVCVLITKNKLNVYTKIYDQLEHHPSINHMKKQQPTPRNCNHQKELATTTAYQKQQQQQQL
jgi:hypothetical protein